MHKVIQYRNRCIGCGICYELQPELWRMSKKDGKASLLKAIGKKQVSILRIPDSEVPKSLEIAAACPVRIIKIT